MTGGIGRPGPVERVRRGGPRAELVRSFRLIRRLRLATVLVTAAAIVAGVLLLPRLHDATRDGTAVALDELRLPSWITVAAPDRVDGNRWCVSACRVRERQWRSGRGIDDTGEAVLAALTGRQWTPTADCAGGLPGRYHCYHRDEYALDVWIHDRECADPRQLCRGALLRAVIRPQAADVGHR